MVVISSLVKYCVPKIFLSLNIIDFLWLRPRLYKPHLYRHLHALVPARDWFSRLECFCQHNQPESEALCALKHNGNQRKLTEFSESQ
jgi:hypothetical protein